MKYSIYLLLTFFALCMVIDAKSKKTSSKFEGDFEFVDEDDKDNTSKQATMSEKKKWIHDPSSDLCKPLNCKKKELCLLEDAFTAVCVSKKELHKNRDEIVSKTKYLEAEAKRTADLEDSDELDSQGGSEGDDASDDDVFYDTEDNDLDEDNCKPCPVVKPTFLCGSDNRTYSSLCRLTYHNCIHTTAIKVSCKGFCPCKQDSIDSKKRQRMADRINAFNAKYQRTLQQTQNDLKQQQRNEVLSNIKVENANKNHLNNNDVVTEYKFTPEDVKYDNKHYKYIKYTTFNNNKKTHENDIGMIKINSAEDKHKVRSYNDVLEKPSNYNNKLKGNTINQNVPKQSKTECKPQQLTAIGNRLLDWFSVIMSDTKKRHTRVESKVHFPPTCKMEAKWMFGHLDLNSDGLLSSQEMYDLEHDQNEKCIKPFIDNCDTDTDMNLTPREWCRCFEQTDRPCAAVRRRLTGDLVGSYAPDCDVQGFYKSTQCHSSIGVCWCVDKHGVEFANTRTRGKPKCDEVSSKDGLDEDMELDDDEEPDNDDDDDSSEGSADRLLIF